MAEKEGFEPSIGINLYTLSRRAPSAARPFLRNSLILKDFKITERVIVTYFCGYALKEI